MENWYLYNQHRQLIKTSHLRDEKIPEGLFHIGVAAWLFDGEKFLITQRSKEKSFAFTWENTGGNAIDNETSNEAILREVREEVGLEVDQIRLLSTVIDKENHCLFDTYFIFVPQGFKNIYLDSKEVAASQCLSYNELVTLMQSNQVCEIIKKKFFDHKNQIKEIMNGYIGV